MIWEFKDRTTNGILTIRVSDRALNGKGFLKPEKDTINTFVLNKGEAQQAVIDGIPYTFPPNTILPLVANQHFEFEDPEALVAWQFNREFYCIVEHDAEVGCVGFLFYGIHHPFFISLCEAEIQGMKTIEALFIEDIEMKDFMQGELLRTMLKRLIIKVTRIARKQAENFDRFTNDRIDIIRMFNLLVEANFRQQHEVQFYAKALNKSPKTLSNIFSLSRYPAPLNIIHRRIILEAMRYLRYTQKSAKEIAYELGFANPAHFSRFFKMKTGQSFSDQKENHQRPQPANE